jgi:hypothetical protein
VQFTEFWQRFVAAEVRGNALDIRLLGMQLYPVLRTRIYYQIAQGLGLFDDPHPDAGSAKASADASSAEEATGSAGASSPDSGAAQPAAQAPATIDLAALAPARDVVVPFIRRVGGVDPYSQPLYDALTKASQPTPAKTGSTHPTTTQAPTQATTPSRENLPLLLDFDDPEAPLDIERIRSWARAKFEDWVASETIKQKVRDHDERWQLLTASLEAEFGVHLEKFHEYPRWFFRRYIAEVKGFEAIFRALKTRRLFIVNAYSNPALVVGAKLAGAKVIELQHGFLSPYHPAYSYPRALARSPQASPLKRIARAFSPLRPLVQTAPDRLLTWGDYWSTAAELPAPTRAVTIGPSGQFASARARVRAELAAAGASARDQLGSDQLSTDTGAFDLTPHPETILFTSQGAIGPRLFAAALDFARELPDHRVIYRLHPNEALADYEKLLAEAGTTSAVPANLTLSHKDPSFLELLGQSDYLVGGFSTTLFEGLAFGLKVLVLPLPGYENLQPALDSGDMLRIISLDPEQIRYAIEHARPAINPARYYAETTDLAKALRA